MSDSMLVLLWGLLAISVITAAGRYGRRQPLVPRRHPRASVLGPRAERLP